MENPGAAGCGKPAARPFFDRCSCRCIMGTQRQTKTYQTAPPVTEMTKLTGTKSQLSDFIDGMARIFDFTGALNRRRRYTGSGFERDAAALRSDWIAVGNDIRAAMGQFEAQEGIQHKEPLQ